MFHFKSLEKLIKYMCDLQNKHLVLKTVVLQFLLKYQQVY